MQRRITLLRHGHAEENSDDFARPLSKAGRAAALQAGQALARAGWVPDHLLTSSAPRALATAELVASASGYSGPIQVERALYLAAESQCLAWLRRLSEQTTSVLLVAHNPGLTALARELCQLDTDLAPAEYASVVLDLADWAEL